MSRLFPETPRNFRARRPLKIAMRTLHIITSGVFIGAVLFDQPPQVFHAWLAAAVGSGLGIFLLDLYATCAILFEVRGMLVFLKIALLFGVYLFWHHPGVPIAIAVVGSVGSHMSGSLRHRLLCKRTLRVDLQKG